MSGRDDDAPIYRRLRPLLFGLDAERAHRLTTGAARLAQAAGGRFVEPMFAYGHGALAQRLWGLSFTNPIGLAAGFDKNARLVRFWEQLGFGFAEVGSVTALPAKGNPRPRAFRLPEDRALINRMGLNNDGAARVARRLERLGPEHRLPLGINLAKTPSDAILGDAAVEDFRRSFRHLAPLADYVTLNISCPNTEDGRTFEEPEGLDKLLSAIFAERGGMGLAVPVLVKFSPPFSTRVVLDSQIDEIVAVALDHNVDGFVATNTAPDREGLTTPEARLAEIGRGGMSGAPLRARSTHLVRYLYKRTSGHKPIIGVGGIDSAEAAYEKIRAGASLVQVYTGLIYEGPGLVRRLKEGLARLLERDGVGAVREAVGADA